MKARHKKEVAWYSQDWPKACGPPRQQHTSEVDLAQGSCLQAYFTQLATWPVYSIVAMTLCIFFAPPPDMQFVTNFTRIKFQNNFLPKRVNYDKLRFPTKQGKLYFHITNIHTQGYITLNKYLIGIANTGLPKVNLWATK